jgi:L-arabinokinase
MELRKTNRSPGAADALLGPFENYLREKGHTFFAPSHPITVGRGPARLDVMGGIADYSGSVVFEATLGRAAVVGFQPRTDGRLCVRSTWLEQLGRPSDVEINLADLREKEGPANYATLRETLTSNPDERWAAYLLGAIPVLEREENLRLEHGANMLLWSDVPVGVGVASSAAVEVAAMFALTRGINCELQGERLAALAQIVENQIVGAPCGIMDQVTSALGKEDQLLALRCQRCEVLGLHELPEQVSVFGISSHVEHSVGGDPYTKARVSAFMGLKIMLDAMKRSGEEPTDRDRYLCNIDPRTYREKYRDLLPERIRGEEFLQRYGETTDPVTEVDPGQIYSVRVGTEHPIFENHRVQAFIECLDRARAGDRTALVEAGGLMYASHCSYSWNCALGCHETDLIVQLVREHGPESGLYGAKVTGGGSGGTVAVLADTDSEDVIATVADEYSDRTDLTPDVFDSTSPGAYAFGSHTYKLQES